MTPLCADRSGHFKAPTETNTVNESPMLHSR